MGELGRISQIAPSEEKVRYAEFAILKRISMTKTVKLGNFACQIFKEGEEVPFETVINMVRFDNRGELVTQQLDEHFRNDMGSTDRMLYFISKEESDHGFVAVKGTHRLISQDAYGNYNVIELEGIIKREMEANIKWPDVGGEKNPPSEAGSQEPGYGGFRAGDSRAVSAASSRKSSPLASTASSPSSSPTFPTEPETPAHFPEENMAILR